MFIVFAAKRRRTAMNETQIILLNMRGGCATVGNTVHTLFRVTSRRSRRIDESKENPVAAPFDPELRKLLQQM
jgi:hypothetical protein